MAKDSSVAEIWCCEVGHYVQFSGYLLKDKTFYIESDSGLPKLKKSHEYYSQIQMAMGLSGAAYCDFIVYTLVGLIIARTPYDHDRFINIMTRVNTFYKQYMLPKLCTSKSIAESSEEWSNLWAHKSNSFFSLWLWCFDINQFLLIWNILCVEIELNFSVFVGLVTFTTRK